MTKAEIKVFYQIIREFSIRSSTTQSKSDKILQTSSRIAQNDSFIWDGEKLFSFTSVCVPPRSFSVKASLMVLRGIPIEI